MSYPKVLSAYGAKDVWQLVERVSELYLGGAVNSVQQRTLAQSGARIIRWLMTNQSILSSPDAGGLDFTKPEQQALVADVDRWLAVAGTDDAATEK